MKKTKTIKKALVAILAAITAVTCASCGGGGGGFGIKETKKGEGVLNIALFDGGYGTAFLENIADAYESVTGVDVEISTFVTNSQPTNQVKGGTYVADIIFNISSAVREGIRGTYLPLTDVLMGKANESEEKTIYEKLGVNGDDYLFKTSDEDAGTCYQMPWTYGKMGLFYNKTSLESLIGTSYTLPRTTDELIAFCDRIKAANGWAFVHTNSIEMETYCDFRNILAAQVMGLEGYRAYYNGEYINASGEKVKAQSYEELDDARYDAIMSALEVTSKIASSSSGYTPASVKTMDFMKAQAYFWGVTSQSDYKPTVFMINGDWYYSEVDYLAEAKASDIRMMRMPINSKIKDVLDSVTSDAQLSECIAYCDSIIDGGNMAKPAYLSDKDAARLLEARRLCNATHMRQTAAIPNNSANVEEAKNFLRFFASDEACRIYSKFMYGMYSPYNSEIYDEKSINTFVRSVNEATKGAIMMEDHGNSVMYIIGGLGFFSYQYFQSKINKGETPLTIWQSSRDNYCNKWNEIVAASQLV